MMIGANKDGWWDEVKLMHQSEDLLDFLEAWDIDGKYQFVGHFDQSVAHNKKNGNALVCLLSYTHERAHTHTYIHACMRRRLPRMLGCLGGASKLCCAKAPSYLTVLVIPNQKCILSLVQEADNGKMAPNGLTVLVPVLLKRICR